MVKFMEIEIRPTDNNKKINREVKDKNVILQINNKIKKVENA